MLLLIHPFSFSCFFPSNFQILNIFLALFSGTVRPKRLKFGTHVNNGWMYREYQNATAAACLFLYFFIFLSLQFSNIKNLVALLSGIVSHRKLKLATHMNNGFMYRVYHTQAAAAAYSSFFFIFLSLQFSKINIFQHTFLRSREARLGSQDAAIWGVELKDNLGKSNEFDSMCTIFYKLLGK